jgi:hypothetical protein
MAKLGRLTTILCLVIGMLALADAQAQTRA